MKRLRVRFWDWLFRLSTALGSFALERRCRACGCAACSRVAHITRIFRKSGSPIIPGRGLIDNAGDHGHVVLN